jgi:hypothetical protein
MELLERACSPRDKVSKAALAEAKLLPQAEQILLFRAVLEYAKTASEAWKKISARHILALFVWGYAHSISPVIGVPEDIKTFPLLLLSVYLLMGPNQLRSLIHRQSIKQLRQCLIEELEQPESFEVVWFFYILAVEHRSDKEFLAISTQRLKEALPLINREVAERIPKSQISALYFHLQHPCDDVEFTLRILHAIPYFADEAALSHVYRLKHAKRVTPAMERVADAARVCYDQLQAAIAERKESGLLLRPSSSNIEEAKALLRPSEENPEDKRDLLRPQI